MRAFLLKLTFKLILLTGWLPPSFETFSFRTQWTFNEGVIVLFIFKKSEPEELLLYQVITQ